MKKFGIVFCFIITFLIIYFLQVNIFPRFTINGVLTAWFTPAERSNYKSSIEAAKLLGQNTLAFFVEDTLLQVPTNDAEYMLAQIQLYADRCFLVTKNHKVNVMNLETIEEVEKYDYKINYPEKINFNLG